jgi:hypothetical protein
MAVRGSGLTKTETYAPPRQRTFVMITVCTENLIGVDDVMESPKLAE